MAAEERLEGTVKVTGCPFLAMEAVAVSGVVAVDERESLIFLLQEETASPTSKRGIKNRMRIFMTAYIDYTLYASG